MENQVLLKIFERAAEILNFITKPSKTQLMKLVNETEMHPDILYALAAGHAAEMKKRCSDKHWGNPLPKYTVWLLLACTGVIEKHTWIDQVKNALLRGFRDTFYNEDLNL